MVEFLKRNVNGMRQMRGGRTKDLEEAGRSE
jgi:hypothetical protein